jgi:hypothetical protein
MSRQKLKRALMAPTSQILKGVLEQEREVTNNWLSGVLVGRAPRQDLRPKPLRRDDTFLTNTLQSYGEIDASLTSLQTIAKLARRSPPKNIHVDPGEQLKLFVESYLGEVYLLRERSEAMTSKLTRAYRNNADAAQIARTLSDAYDGVSEVLSPVVVARGAHVHEQRHRDFEMDRLATLRILSEKSDEPMFRSIRKEALRGIRKAKTQWMTAINKDITDAIDIYFAALHGVVFDGDDSPRFPTAGRRRE